MVYVQPHYAKTILYEPWTRHLTFCQKSVVTTNLTRLPVICSNCMRAASLFAMQTKGSFMCTHFANSSTSSSLLPLKSPYKQCYCLFIQGQELAQQIIIAFFLLWFVDCLSVQQCMVIYFPSSDQQSQRPVSPNGHKLIRSIFQIYPRGRLETLRKV